VQLFIRMLRDAGFQRAERVPTDGFPGVFATLDAGAPRTVGLYFMYDVKQVDPREWSSPPWEARLVDKPGFGKVVVGRGAVNQKGPEATFLAALHALRGAGRKPPVNLVLVAEGEEEIGSVHFAQVVRKPEIAAALAKTVGIYMPFAAQDPDGNVTINLGAKGVIELELIASGEKWGRGGARDAGVARRRRPRHRRIFREGAPALGRRGAAHRHRFTPAERSAGEEDAQRAALGARHSIS
jgi:acetylornithine deacetylase/succinyl-diaminopimelate desuccinylase-like protein